MKPGPRPRPAGSEPSRTRLTDLVSAGLGRQAIARIIDDPPPLSHVRDELVDLRRAGFHREAAVIELVVTSPDAAALSNPDIESKWFSPVTFRGRLAMIAIAASGAIHPFVPLSLLVGVVGACGWWIQRRRRAVGRDGWRLLLSWWLEPLRTSAPHQIVLLLGLVCALAVFIGGLVEGSAGMLAGAVAAAAPMIWLAVRARTDRVSDVAWAPAPRREVDAQGVRAELACHRGSSCGAIEVPRPQPMNALLPLLALGTAVLLITVNVALPRSIFIALPFVGFMALVWKRATAATLRFDHECITYRGLFRTRRWNWDEVRTVRAKDDGEQKARVEVVPVGSRSIQLWSGSLDDPVLIQFVNIGRAHATGTDPSRWSRRGCLTVGLWAAVLIGVVSIGGILQSPALVPVDPATVPEGVEVQRDADATGEMRGQPYVYCARAFSDPAGWEPPGCADERDGQELFIVVMGLATSVAAMGLVLSYRRARRDGRPAPEGPIS